MNLLFKISTFYLLLIISMVSAEAQVTRHDSINIQLGDQMEIHMVIKDPKSLDTTFFHDFNMMKELMKDPGSIPERAGYSLFYKPGKSLTLGDNSQYRHVVWDEKGKKHYQFDNQVCILAETYTFQMLFNDIQNVRSEAIMDKIRPVLDSMAHKKCRTTAITAYSLKDGRLHLDSNETKSGTDYLYINGGVGAGVIGSHLYTDLKAELGIGFSKYGYVRSIFYTSYAISYFGSSKIFSNEMIHVGYRYNVGHDITKPNYFGVELGYLVHHEGDLLGKNAFKFGVNWELGKMITVSPEIYFYDKFNVTVPGIRIGFGF